MPDGKAGDGKPVPQIMRPQAPAVVETSDPAANACRNPVGDSRLPRELRKNAASRGTGKIELRCWA
jgi:hypothetical protein